MIHKKWLELLGKYTFIDKIERRGIKYCFYYTVKGEQLCKKVSLRATPTMLQKIIKDIKNEVGVTPYGKSKNINIMVV